MRPVTTANPHDNGYDLVPGRSITNSAIGKVFWDDSDPNYAGLVMRIEDEDRYEETYPADGSDAAEILRRHGYEPDDTVIGDIDGLADA